jgi:hypothetical protein
VQAAANNAITFAEPGQGVVLTVNAVLTCLIWSMPALTTPTKRSVKR